MASKGGSNQVPRDVLPNFTRLLSLCVYDQLQSVDV